MSPLYLAILIPNILIDKYMASFGLQEVTNDTKQNVCCEQIKLKQIWLSSGFIKRISSNTPFIVHHPKILE